MSVLLRQPGGFESFGTVAEEVHAYRPALAERDDLVEELLSRGSACLSAAPQVHKCEQSVATVDDLFRVGPKSPNTSRSICQNAFTPSWPS